MILDINKAFPAPVKTRQTTKAKRNYDVRITINKNGHKRGGLVIRFGFINRAAVILGDHPFIETSDIEYTKDRVYFRTHEEKKNKNIHTLSFNTKTRQDGCYFSITPNEKTEKIYRMNWIGKTFPMLYDEENDLYYIENTKED